MAINDNILEETEWDDFIENAPCGFILAEKNGQIKKVNKTLTNWLGYQKEELVGVKKFSDLLSIGGKIFYETKHFPLIKMQTMVNELNYDMVCMDKKRIPVLVNTARKIDEEGEIISLQFVILPFWDRKKYEKELLYEKKRAEIATEAKSIFLSTVTHEIRTPINIILNAIKILLDENPRSDQLELLEVSQFSTENLLEIINAVLDISKMESGQVEMNNRPFDLPLLMKILIRSFRPEALAKGINLTLSVSENLPKFFIGDAGKLRQVITNLIGNSIKFTDSGFVKLEISFKEKENLIQFKVIDSGIGIKAEHLKKIFTPFSQADKKIQSDFGGTGLGLSISQKLIKAFGSELKVESEFGSSTTFSFDLQLNQAENLPQNTFESKSEIEIPKGFKVLVVDDIYSNVLIITRYFKKWNVLYDFAKNGFEALEKVQKNDYDIVFMDISMPKIDGFETSSRIRLLGGEKYQQLPIVVLSAFDSQFLEKKMEKYSINKLLLKPFDPIDLLKIIHHYGQLSTTKKNTIQINKDTLSADSKEPEDLGKVDFTKVNDFFDNEEKEILNYIKIVLVEFPETKKELEAAVNNFSLEEYKNAVHKTSSLVRMLGLHELKSNFNKAIVLIKENDRSSFIEISKRIKRMMEEILNQLKKRVAQE